MANLRGIVTQEELDKLSSWGITPDTPPWEEGGGDEINLWAEFYVDCDVFLLLSKKLSGDDLSLENDICPLCGGKMIEDLDVKVLEGVYLHCIKCGHPDTKEISNENIT